MVVATLYIPGGISQNEVSSSISSSHVSIQSFSPDTIIDLPYGLLQRASFELLGVTTFSIKLPSLILSILSIIGIILLLRHWFHDNVAAIATLVIITASQFIFASQDGTPAIMYIAIPTWLLLMAMKVSRQPKNRGLWEVLLIAALAISLYTPLSIYIILALASATILHPHLRFIVSSLSKKKLALAGIAGLAILSPLILALVQKPELSMILLGIPDTKPDLMANSLVLLDTYLGLSLSEVSDQFKPIYTLPLLILVLIGITRLAATRYTARSYIITSWILLLAPVILVNPTKTTLTFVPVILLAASGIDRLLHRWYRLFPRNPYARVAGLLPITLLVSGIATAGIERYFYAYNYSPETSTYFVNDLSLIHREIDNLEGKPLTLLTTEKEATFYRVVSSHEDNLNILAPSDPIPDNSHLLVTRDVFSERDLGAPSKIITNSRSQEADRLYLYNPEEK